MPIEIDGAFFRAEALKATRPLTFRSPFYAATRCSPRVVVAAAGLVSDPPLSCLRRGRPPCRAERKDKLRERKLRSRERKREAAGRGSRISERVVTSERIYEAGHIEISIDVPEDFFLCSPSLLCPRTRRAKKNCNNERAIDFLFNHVNGSRICTLKLSELLSFGITSVVRDVADFTVFQPRIDEEFLSEEF